MQRQQQERQDVHSWPQGQRAYNLGLVMGQHVDIRPIAIYRRHLYYRAFPERHLRVAVLVSVNN